MKKYVKAMLLVGCLLMSTFSFAQVSLGIGDAAPPFKYSKCIQGSPVTTYEKDRLYVVEFWATWCGPCIAAMPHLSELSVNYKTVATFIGVNIWEKTGEEPYESSLPKVASFVKNQGEKLTYNVLVDNNEQYMGNNWMKAAGQLGIPSTFMIQNGKIIWIGHPIALDSIIPLVITGKYDMEEYKKGFDSKTEKLARMMQTYRSFIDPANVAIKAKEYEKAIALIEQGEAATPTFSTFYRIVKAKALFGLDEKKAIDSVKVWFKESASLATVVIEDIANRDDLSKTTYAFAADYLSQQATGRNSDMPQSSILLAKLYSKLEEFPNAVAAQQKGIALAKAALAEGKYKELVTEKTIEEYETVLKQYQKKDKNL